MPPLLADQTHCVYCVQQTAKAGDTKQKERNEEKLDEQKACCSTGDVAGQEGREKSRTRIKQSHIFEPTITGGDDLQ